MRLLRRSLLGTLTLSVAAFGAARTAAQAAVYRGPGDLPMPTAMPPGWEESNLDLTDWEFWWEHHKNRFLARDSHGVARVDSRTVLDRILPQLECVLATDPSRDVVAACLIALAKLGKSHHQIAMLDTFRERLGSKERSVSHAAVLAMGILARIEAVPDLRRIVAAHAADSGSRSRALLALGLIAQANPSLRAKRDALSAARDVLLAAGPVERELGVAAVVTISLLGPDLENPTGRALWVEAVDALEALLDRDLGANAAFVQAHVPTALARLCTGVEPAELRPRVEECRRRWLATVRAGAAQPDLCVQSAILALGRACAPTDDEATALLAEYQRRGADTQARNFATIALGEIGGSSARTTLLAILRGGSKALERPWAALALGVLVAKDVDRKGTDDEIDAALRDALTVRNPSTLAAVALALGLTRSTTAAPQLAQLLETNLNKDDLAGYLATALALLRDPESHARLVELFSQSYRRPDRARHLAVALQSFGDPAALPVLCERFGDSGAHVFHPTTLAAIARAVGSLGDAAAIDPAIKVLWDPESNPRRRVAAVAALGAFADRAEQPWNQVILRDLNYRATSFTLSQQSTGILTIE